MDNSSIVDVSKLSWQELLDLKNSLEALHNVEERAGTAKWFVEGTGFSIDHYPKHKLWFEASATHKECVFLAANRSGKSQAGGCAVAYHATGDYPKWWKGKRFEHPVDIWVAGKDKTTTRDTIQRILLGGTGTIGTGTIAANRIIKTWSMQGVPNGVELAHIRHKSGGKSTIGFKSYDRGVDSFMGTAQHVIWLDEECPSDVYNECLIRTMTTGGIVLSTFTPLKGLTQLVLHLCSTGEFLSGDRFVEKEANTDTSRAIVMASWDDVPHLDAEAKVQILAATPPYLRKARSEGVPTIGEGTIYPIVRSEVECEPFVIPDHFERWYGMDVGWNQTSCVFFAKDPDSGQMYVTHEYKGQRSEPLIHAEAIKGIAGSWMPGAIDPGSHNRGQQDGQKLFNIYRSYGLHITNANNSVESGIAQCWEFLSTGKLKIFKHCNEFFREYMIYRREGGTIKKVDDHLMDAFRYGVNTRHIARVKPKDAGFSGGYSYGKRLSF